MAAFCGAAVLVLAGIMTPEAVGARRRLEHHRPSGRHDDHVGVTRETGVFEYLAIRAAKMARAGAGILAALAAVTAILSALKAQPERKEIITTVVEHPAVLALCEHLEKEGYRVHYLKVDGKGRLDLAEYQKLLSDQTAIVSIMWANNESGTLFPVVEMAEMAWQAGVMFHTDAVQAVGKIPMDLKNTKIDLLSLSGHKLHAPRDSVYSICAGAPASGAAAGRHQERGARRH